VIADREQLEQRVFELSARYQGADPPLPESWGGFRLEPESFEFWKHRDDRLHDRLLYSRGADGGWALERLAP
jgi:pyridoxamine 5'-phosphate oxidase